MLYPGNLLPLLSLFLYIPLCLSICLVYKVIILWKNKNKKIINKNIIGNSGTIWIQKLCDA